MKTYRYVFGVFRFYNVIFLISKSYQLWHTYQISYFFEVFIQVKVLKYLILPFIEIFISEIFWTKFFDIKFALLNQSFKLKYSIHFWKYFDPFQSYKNNSVKNQNKRSKFFKIPRTYLPKTLDKFSKLSSDSPLQIIVSLSSSNFLNFYQTVDAGRV